MPRPLAPEFQDVPHALAHIRQTDAAMGTSDLATRHLTPFLGDDRDALVALLVTTFDDVWDQRVPAWVSLEAGTGWGKTRIVRELYRRLAAERQLDDEYWPVAWADAPSSRKSVYPEAWTVPSGAELDWLWLGLSSGKGTGSVGSLAQCMQQLEEHEQALWRRWKAQAGPVRRVTSGLRANESTLTESAASEGLSLVARAADAAFPGLSALFSITRQITASVLERRERAADASTVDVPALSVQLVDEAVAAIVRISATLPVVIAVEDLHEADEYLIGLLGRLAAAPGAAVLVVSTGWAAPGVDAPVRRFVAGAASDGAARLPELAPQDRAKIVRQWLPAAAAETVKALVERYVTPLTLELVVGLPESQQAVAVGAPPDTWVPDLPESLRDIYRSSWVSLSPQVQDRLMLGALWAAELDDGLMRMWDEQTLDAALQRCMSPPWPPPLAPGPLGGWVQTYGDLRAFQ